jgi:hypothetical protein
MKTSTTRATSIVCRYKCSLGAMLTVALMVTSVAVSQSPTPVDLGSASNFAVLGGSTVTNADATTISGDLGVSPGTAITGTPTVNGTIHAGDGVAANARSDVIAAYSDAAGRTDNTITLAGNLGGDTLTPGLYNSASTLEISSGDLTLDAGGDASAVFIFQMGSTLTTTSGRQVFLIGKASAYNIFWQVGSSATLGPNSVFKGTILASAAITLEAGAILEGRALAGSAAVALTGNVVTRPVPAPLPVQLASFTLTIVNGASVQLAWRTISETNNFGYYVQRKLASESSFVSVPNSFVSGHGTTLVPQQYSFTDNSKSGVQSRYRLKQVDLDGNIRFTDPISITIPASVSKQLPPRFTLQQNYPNPFNPSTLISFATAQEGPVSLRVYDILGREVATLVNENRKPGEYTERFDGSKVASGMYVFVLRSSEGQRSSRMILSK